MLDLVIVIFIICSWYIVFLWSFLEYVGFLLKKIVWNLYITSLASEVAKKLALLKPEIIILAFRFVQWPNLKPKSLKSDVELNVIIKKKQPLKVLKNAAVRACATDLTRAPKQNLEVYHNRVDLYKTYRLCLL